MKKFCDDHGWVGTPDQSCHECEAIALAEFRRKHPTGRINRPGPELQNIKSSHREVDWNGIQLFKNDLLTGRAMIVSPEVFEMLTETPEQRQAKARALVEKADQLMALCDTLIKSPTI